MFTDHFLVIGKFKVKLKAIQKCKPTKPIDIRKLKDKNIAEGYQIALANRFEILIHSEKVEEQWEMFKNCVVEVAEERLGRRRGSKKEQWITDDTWTKIDERREAKRHRDKAKAAIERKYTNSRY